MVDDAQNSAVHTGEAAIADQSKTVLIVDDDPLVTQSIQHLLKRMGVRSMAASQWAEAIEILERDQPDLMMLDLRMPNVAGETLLEFVRESGHDLPVVVVSGSLGDVDLEHLRGLGVKRFVPKPFSIDQLRAIIEEQIGTDADEGEAANPEPAEDDSLRAVSVSKTRQALGGKWRPDASVRRHRKRQFLVIAVICVLISSVALAAKWAIDSTGLLPSIREAIRSQAPDMRR